MDRIWAQLRVRSWLLAVVAAVLAVPTWLLLHRAPQPLLAPAVAPLPPAAAPAPAAPTANPLEALLARQDQVSNSADHALQAKAGTAPGAAGIAAAPTGAAQARLAAQKTAQEARMARLRTFHDIQARAMAEISAVPPGDNKRMLDVITRFDAQMRAAGAPAIINIDNLRKMMESSQRMQELNKKLLAEAEKGRAADPVKLRSMSQEMSALQAAMPHQFVNQDVLQRTLKR